MERSIVEALKSACGNKNLKFQIIIRDRKLHIYVNHRQDRKPNYLLLEATVTATIASLDLEAIEGVYLYSRPFGTVAPNWQTRLEIPELQQRDSDEADTIGTTQEQEAALPDSTVRSTSDRSPEDMTELAEEGGISDTGLLKNRGLIHGSPLQEEEIATSLTGSRETEVPRPPQVAPTRDLAQYCFVPHKKLLTGDIIFPEKEIVRLVKFFHHLSNRQRRELLPILEAYFQSKTKPDPENLSFAVQKWLKQIDELNSEARQMFAIWLSRYCFDPNTTIAELESATARNTKIARTAAKYRPTEYSFTPAKTKADNLADKFEQSSESGFGLPPTVKKLLLPGGWIFATVILLLVAILSNNPTSTSQIPALCSNTIGSTEYCRLAVNLAGVNQVARSETMREGISPNSLFPLTDVTETVATYACQRYANLKAGNSDIAPEKAPAISSYGEKVFPHLYVVRVEQRNAEGTGRTAVGCVYTAGQNQRSPKLLAADIIPLDWPAEPYRSEKNANLAFGKFTNPIKLGLYTICAAVGIAIASRLNLGIKIHRIDTVYLVALILGILQLVVSLVPVLGSFGTTTILILTVFTISFWFEDFRLDWHRNRIAVVVGVFSIVAIQFLLYGVCLAAIGSLI